MAHKKKWHYKAPLNRPEGERTLRDIDPLGHGHNVFTILLEEKMADSARVREAKALSAQQAQIQRDLRAALARQQGEAVARQQMAARVTADEEAERAAYEEQRATRRLQLAQEIHALQALGIQL